MQAFIPAMAQTQTVILNDKEYAIETLLDRDLGPGVRYTRLRLPAYPLNVNLLRIDVTNPYNSVETTQGSDKLYSTEGLVNAAKRQSSAQHQALAGANANFWCVGGQPPYSDQLLGVTYNGNLKNGKIITETNMHNDQWNGGYKHTGITGVTPDGRAYSGNFTWTGTITSTATGTAEFFSANKLVRDEEISIYNSFYPTTRTFRCVDQAYKEGTTTWTFNIVPNCATEVYLNLVPGQQWSAGGDIRFTVDKVKTNAGDGTIGSYDLAIVGRGSKAQLLERLAPGDEVTLNYTWKKTDGTPVQFSNLVGGNAQVMVNGELTKYNTSENYNSQVYSRTGYGTNADGTTLYIMVIDKATDPVYGTSAGCSTTVMCEIAKLYGVTDMTNYDAGGSAEMLVEGAIINKTTEGSPRAVANGMIVYSTAPADNTITRLAFHDLTLQCPIYGAYTPKLYGYNQYGALISTDVQGVTLSCSAGAGTCSGAEFTASGNPGEYTVTATLGQATVTAPIKVMQAEIAIRLNPVIIDCNRAYPIEVTADIDGQLYTYNPSSISWSVEPQDIVEIDQQGILRALTTQGTATITGHIGEFTDQTTVTIENPVNNILPTTDFNDWTAKCATGFKLTKWENSRLDYTYSNSARSPQLTFTPAAFTSFSLPDEMTFEFTTSTPIEKINVDVRSRIHTRANKITLTQPDGSAWQPGTHTVTLPMPGETSDLQTYPYSINAIDLYPTKDATYNGDQNVTLHAINQHYNWVQGIDNISAGGNDPSAPVQIYNIQGMRVTGHELTPGLYIIRQGTSSTKILVK